MAADVILTLLGCPQKGTGRWLLVGNLLDTAIVEPDLEGLVYRVGHPLISYQINVEAIEFKMAVPK